MDVVALAILALLSQQQKQMGRASALIETCLLKAPQSKELKLMKVCHVSLLGLKLRNCSDSASREGNTIP